MYIGEFSLYWFFNQFISSFYIHWHFHITTNLVPFTHFINVLICQVVNGTIKTLTNNLLLCLKEPELFGPGGMMENPSVVKQMPDEAARSRSSFQPQCVTEKQRDYFYARNNRVHRLNDILIVCFQVLCQLTPTLFLTVKVKYYHQNFNFLSCTLK